MNTGFNRCGLMRALLAAALIAGAASDGALDEAWQIKAGNKRDAAMQSNLAGIVTALVQTNAGLPGSTGLLQSWWQNFKQTYNKQYATPAEEAAAFENFRQSLKSAQITNNDPSISCWVSPNQFSDMSPAQRAQYLMSSFNPLEGQLPAQQQHTPPRLSRRAERKLLGIRQKDWRAEWKVTPVKNQAQCGSCWAFAATGAVEAAYHIVTKTNASATPLDLSEQNLVSCVKGYSAGCNGGCSDEAITYVGQVGQTTEKSFPYSATTGTCGTQAALTTNNFVKLNNNNRVYMNYMVTESALMDAVDKQPVVIYFYVDTSYNSKFYSYAGGIYKEYTNCKDTTINHAMLAVGYWTDGTTDNSYWIVKNSWDTWWGEKGYVRIGFRGQNTKGMCGMYLYSVAPVLSFAKSIVLPTPSPSPVPSPKQLAGPSPAPSPRPSPSPSPRPSPSPPPRSPSPSPKLAAPQSPSPKPSPSPSPKPSPSPSPKPSPSPSPRLPSPSPRLPSPSPKTAISSPKLSPAPSPRLPPAISFSPKLSPRGVPNMRRLQEEDQEQEE